MTESEHHYIQIPLCLLQETYNKPEQGLNLMIDFGIVNYAMKLSYSEKDVARQLLYDFLRAKEKLQPPILDKLNKLIRSRHFKIPENDGFNYKGEFDPGESATYFGLSGIFAEINGLYQTCIMNYRIHVAAHQLNLSIGSYASTLDRYNKALVLKQEFEKLYGNDAMPMCKAKMLIDFRDKNPEELYILRAYIGIRSLIGRNTFASTHKSTVVMRMLGCKKKEALSALITSNPKAAEEFEKYSRRKQIDKLFLTLMERKFAQILSTKGQRQIYVTVRYNNLREFADAIIVKKRSNDIKRQLALARLRINGASI